jgi:MFS family permease
LETDPLLFDRTAASRRVAWVTFIGGLGGGLVFPILPALGLQLGIAGGVIGLILSANRITRLSFAPWAGRMVDRLGGKAPLSVGLLIECLGILGYEAALLFGHPAWWFLAGRAVFGIGSALLLVGAQAAVLGFSEMADRGRHTASVRIALSMGMPGGLVLGGLIADRFSDGAAFLTGAALTALGALVALWLVPGGRFRTEGALHAGKSSPRTSLRDLLRLPEFPFLASAWGFNLLVFFSVQGVLLATLVLLVERRGFHLFGLAGEGTAGLVMAAMMASSSVLAFLIGRALDRLGLRTVLLLPSLAGLACGFLLLGLAHSLSMTFAGAVLAGISFNGINLPLLALLGDITLPERYGRAVATYQIFGDIGGSLGPILGLEAGLRLGLMPTYLGVAVLLALGVPAVLWVRHHEAARRQGALSS